MLRHMVRMLTTGFKGLNDKASCDTFALRQIFEARAPLVRVVCHRIQFPFPCLLRATLKQILLNVSLLPASHEIIRSFIFAFTVFCEYSGNAQFGLPIRSQVVHLVSSSQGSSFAPQNVFGALAFRNDNTPSGTSESRVHLRGVSG